MKKQLVFGLFLCYLCTVSAQKKELRSANKEMEKENYEKAAVAVEAAESLFDSMDDKQKSEFYLLKSKLFLIGENVSSEATEKSIEAFEKVNAPSLSLAKDAHYITLINHLLDKGSALVEKSDFSAATGYFSNAYRISKKDTIYLYYAASLSAQAKEYDNSLAMYEKLKSLKYTGIKKQYFAIDKSSNKEETFDNKLLRDASIKAKTHTNPTEKNSKSKYPEIIKNMALIYNQLGDTEKALEALKEARVQNPGDFDLIVTEANVHYNLNNLEKFRELLEYAAELEPKNVQLQFNLGVIAADNGDFDNATKYYQRALELDPSNVNSYRALLSMREKSILDEQKQFREF
jgi:tetratricopeptide (TPR) repeat protein